MSSVPTCKCGQTCLSKEAYRGENRGRWYWKCALSRCGFFEWNDPAIHLYTPMVLTLPPTTTTPEQKRKETTERRDTPILPIEDVNYPLGARKSRLASTHRTKRSRTSETINTTKTIIQLTLYTNTDISIHANERHRYIQSLFRTVKGIVWDERLHMWVFSADQQMYQRVWKLLHQHRAAFEVTGIPLAILRYLPKTTEQLYIQHHNSTAAAAKATTTTPTTGTNSATSFSLTQQNEATGDDNNFGDFDAFDFDVDGGDDDDDLSDLSISWFQREVVRGSILWQSMTQKQRIGVKKGAKMDGGIYLHDQIGSGQSLQALAMTLIYQDDWPVLIVCRSTACQSWKVLIKSMLQLDSHDICLLDHVASYNGKKTLSNKRKAIQSRLYRQKRRQLLQEQLRQGITSKSLSSTGAQQQQQTLMDGDDEDGWYIDMTNNGGEDISFFNDGWSERVRATSANGDTLGPSNLPVKKKRKNEQPQQLCIELDNDGGDTNSIGDDEDEEGMDNGYGSENDIFDATLSSDSTLANNTTPISMMDTLVENDDGSNNSNNIDDEDGEPYNQAILNTAQFFIISYDKAKTRLSSLGAEKFKVAIFDDCEDIKTTMMPTYRSSLQRFIRGTKKTIMVSRIPITPKPMESFPLLQIIKPNLFVDYKYFGHRYCDAKHLVFGWDYTGTSNEFELGYLLDRTVLVS